MTPVELEQYLHVHIPLSRAMQVSVIDALPTKIVLSAPLAPNINHRETVFGGSSSALAILAAWSLVHFRLGLEGLHPRLVIQRNSVTYERPVLNSFTATSSLKDEQDWAAFKRMLSRKGRGRIAVNAVLHSEGQSVGHFEGEFVALGPDKN